MDTEIKEYLTNRNKIKTDFMNKKINDNEFREERNKFFEPLLNTNNNNESLKPSTQKSLIPISPAPKLLSLPSTSKTLSNSTTTSNSSMESVQRNTKISAIIATYLSDSTDRSQAGYSLKYHPEKKIFSIGNSVVNFIDSNIVVKGKEYVGTVGLMELLTKSNPNVNKIIQYDYDSYKEILTKTNAIYYNFDPSKNKLITFNRSGKFKIIKEKLFPDLFHTSIGDGLQLILSSDPNELVEQLKLSIPSYIAGNTGEYNRINAILDSLLKNNYIDIQVYKNILTSLFGNGIKPRSN